MNKQQAKPRNSLQKIDICQTINVSEKHCKFNNLGRIAKLAYNLGPISNLEP